MNCNDARRWLDAHLDRELDSTRDAEVAAHFHSCPICTELLRARTQLKTAVAARLPRYAPPAGLAERIRADLRAAAREETARAGEEIDSGPSTSRLRIPTRRRWLDFPGWGGLLTAATCALVLGFALGQRHAASRSLDGLLASHISALTSGRLIEVASSDRHTVKPWLAQHVDFSPPVYDFATAGFPLVGARVEKIDGHSVAALVYQRAKHVVTVFVWPVEAGSLPKPQATRGYHAMTWSQGAFNYTAVADLAPEELERFAGLLRAGQ